MRLVTALLALVVTTTVSTTNAQRRRAGLEISKIRHLSSKKSSKACKKDVETRMWKSMEECCPCCNEENCVAMMIGSGDDDECQRGDDCYTTTYNWPFEVDCVAELNDPHWAHSELCLYDAETSEIKEDGIVFQDAHSFEDCCLQLLGGDFGCTMPVRKLNEGNHAHNRHLVESEDGVSAHVESESPSRMAWLNDHVLDMKTRMESGRTTRQWDPLFKAYFEHVKDINFECESGDSNSMSCSSTGLTECARDLIKAHASYHHEIAASIAENGTHEIIDEHAVPESCRENK